MGSSTKHSLSGIGKKVIEESRTSDSSTSGALMAKLQDTWRWPEWFKRPEVDKVVLRGDKPICIVLPTWLYTDWGKHQGTHQREGTATKSIAWEKWEANMGSIPYTFHLWLRESMILGIALDIVGPRRPQHTLFCSLKTTPWLLSYCVAGTVVSARDGNVSWTKPLTSSCLSGTTDKQGNTHKNKNCKSHQNTMWRE